MPERCSVRISPVANDTCRRAVPAPKYLPERRSTAFPYHYTPGLQRVLYLRPLLRSTPTELNSSSERSHVFRWDCSQFSSSRHAVGAPCSGVANECFHQHGSLIEIRSFRTSFRSLEFMCCEQVLMHLPDVRLSHCLCCLSDKLFQVTIMRSIEIQGVYS